ncbi:hypothetical protein IGI04_003043 [Brassica rapa subsp. trilocularis]|uniref:Uncharacterized protein n=1 Tax=Brassica rapa subsp. trilocularis TaxID=1813537 RepID=A0ABQ7NZ99_BRACM|nr:hypothetical protein IGI04_003043 [Brassica rapa subsp. trilocularis]
MVRDGGAATRRSGGLEGEEVWRSQGRGDCWRCKRRRMSFTAEDSPSGLSEFVILIALKFLRKNEQARLHLVITLSSNAMIISKLIFFPYPYSSHFANDGFDCSLSELKQKNKPVEPSSLNKSRCCRRFGCLLEIGAVQLSGLLKFFAGDKKKSMFANFMDLFKKYEQISFIFLFKLDRPMTHKPGHVMNFLHDGRQLLVVKGRYAAKNSEEILLPYQQREPVHDSIEGEQSLLCQLRILKDCFLTRGQRDGLKL